MENRIGTQARALTIVFHSTNQDFFLQPPARLARRLLGALLVSDIQGRTAGIIVETEAYLGPTDLASHVARHAPRTEIFYRPGGVAYIYRIHQATCFNIIAGPEGDPGGVLIRALEPCEGLPLMAARRGTDDRRKLCSGPGRLTGALGIDLRHLGTSVLSGSPRVLLPDAPPRPFRAGPRIGISRARDRLLRFGLAGSPFLSRPI
jgi:DNA-3-methyladenine glycosylase